MLDTDVKIGHLVVEEGKTETYVVLQQSGSGARSRTWKVARIEIDCNQGITVAVKDKKKEKEASNDGKIEKPPALKTRIMDSSEFDLAPIVINGITFNCRLTSEEIKKLTGKSIAITQSHL